MSPWWPLDLIFDFEIVFGLCPKPRMQQQLIRQQIVFWMG